ncbi:MAG: hypothetical protein D6725_05390 [Planctomycetota bacterium]|nr:MAG: hypothetical protein D6725_05390 [Planctomycetota bacterium]
MAARLRRWTLGPVLPHTAFADVSAVAPKRPGKQLRPPAGMAARVGYSDARRTRVVFRRSDMFR